MSKSRLKDTSLNPCRFCFRSLTGIVFEYQGSLNDHHRMEIVMGWQPGLSSGTGESPDRDPGVPGGPSPMRDPRLARFAGDGPDGATPPDRPHALGPIRPEH